MARIGYRLRGKSELKTIHMVLYYGDFEYTQSTKQRVKLEDWNDSKNEVRKRSHLQFDEMNRFLRRKEKELLDAYEHLLRSDQTIDNITLRKYLKGENEPKRIVPNDLVSFIDFWLLDADKRFVSKGNGRTEPIAESTIKQYRNTQNKLREFDSYKGSPTLFQDLDDQYHKSFMAWFVNLRGYGTSTASTRIKNIKTLAREAENLGLQVNKLVFTRRFPKPSYKTTHTYLNEDEIRSIYELDLSSNKRLDNARDIFIIGLWTGFRISDLKRLKSENIDLKTKVIAIEQFKTKELVSVPVIQEVQQTLLKHGGNLPTFISDQKYNDYIKEVCRLAGIIQPTKGSKKIETKGEWRLKEGIFPKWELISSHTARRSFATNMYQKGVSSNTLMRITGHKTEAAFLKYLKSTPKDHLDEFRRVLESNQISK